LEIKEAIAWIIHDHNVDPALFRVIFKRQEGEYWDVPFNFLKFQGGYFSYSEAETIYPIHRIVAIYDHRGIYYVKRKYTPERVIMKPDGVEIIPGIPIDKYMDPFVIARHSWLIVQHVEKIAEGSLDDAATVLGDFKVLDNIYLIISGYFSGTIIFDGKILRGVKPLDYSNIADRLTYQRICVYPNKEVAIFHRLDNTILKVEKESIIRYDIHKIRLPPYYSAITINEKTICLIDNKTKLIVHPTKTIDVCKRNNITYHEPKIIVTKKWLWHKQALLLITDYDTILARKD